MPLEVEHPDHNEGQSLQDYLKNGNAKQHHQRQPLGNDDDMTERASPSQGQALVRKRIATHIAYG